MTTNHMRCPLSLTAEKYSSRPAIIDSNREITYGLLQNLVHLTTVNLNKHKIQKGSRVAILGTNSPEYCILILAILRIGAIVCPINSRMPEKAVYKALNDLVCEALIFINSPQKIFRVAGVKLLLAEELVPIKSDRQGFQGEPEVFLNSPAVIMYTSGTGATPKAALLSYGNIYFNAVGANERIPFDKNHRWLLTLPLYHVGGWGILFRAIVGGGGMVIPDKNESIPNAINKYNVTHLSLVPTQLYRLLNESITKIKGEAPVLLVGGGPVPKKLIEKCRKAKLNLYRTYGLTEMASQVTAGKSDNGLHSGKLLPLRELKIAADGEILVKGNTLFLGCLKNNAVNLPVDADGWFHTGDIGELDRKGYLTVHGRKDNMIISGGENIHPEEIESWFLQVPGIESALVVGIKDQEFGQRPAAFVKYSDSKRPTEKEIIRELEKLLPRFKIPRTFLEWPEHLADGAFKLPRAEFQKLAAQKRVKRTKKTPVASF